MKYDTDWLDDLTPLEREIEQEASNTLLIIFMAAALALLIFFGYWALVVFKFVP